MRLPREKRSLAQMLDRLADRSQSQYMARRTTWLLAWYYLNGYRRFDVYDPTDGKISPHYLDEEGNAEFQSQELLFAINQVCGRIQGMDVRPKVEQEGTNLAGLRDRSVAQILSDSLVSEGQLRSAQEMFAWLYTCLGFAGITGHIVDHPTIGLTSDIEVIHPRELYPFPMVGQDFTKMRGLVRERMVPVSFLKEVYGRRISDNMDSLDWYTVDASDDWTEPENADEDMTTRGYYYMGETGGGPPKEEAQIAVARVRELWVFGVQNTVDRYLAVSGEYVMDDQDLRDMEVYCPIGWARFFNNGTFHGAGMFDLMFSIHREMETLQKELFNNVREIDRYGVLVLPQGEMNENQILREVGRGLKVMFWQPDPIAEGFNPFPIQPFNSGDMPGRVAQFAKDAMQTVNPIQDLVKEKGRVDSATGLQFLDEQITRALTSPTLGVQKAFGDMYKSLVQKGLQKVTISPRAVPVGQLTLDLAGAIINPENDSVTFDENPIPSLSRLHFTIRDVSPKSVVARKQEAVQLWQMGIEQDPVAFRLFALKESLDFALYLEDDQGAYEAAIRHILTLYGNGESPGEITITPHTSKPELVLRMVSGFMTGPAMQSASPEVIDEFRRFRELLISWMGMTLPAMVPNPDDAAMLAMGAGVMPSAGGPTPQMATTGPM